MYDGPGIYRSQNLPGAQDLNFRTFPTKAILPPPQQEGLGLHLSLTLSFEKF